MKRPNVCLWVFVLDFGKIPINTNQFYAKLVKLKFADIINIPENYCQNCQDKEKYTNKKKW